MVYGDEASAEISFSVDSPDDTLTGERQQDNGRSAFSQTQRRSPAAAAIVVGLIDGDPFIRDCITTSLREACSDVDVLTIANCSEALKLEKLPDVIIYRYAESEDSGESLSLFDPSLLKLMKTGSLILLSPIEHAEIIIEAFENGARGFIPTKSASIKLVAEIIRLVKAGGTFVPPSSLSSRMAAIAGDNPSKNPTMSFTPRELGVLGLLKRGKANKIIAHELNISESTVKIHVRSIMRKLKVTNRTAVVSRIYAEKIGARCQRSV